jgi:uncharacterized RDD family membrane protein YckC
VTQAPGLARRLGSMLYESILLFGVWFFAVWVFQFAAGTFQIDGWRRHLLQGFILVVFALYFLWCWLRSGQTLAMKTWRIKVVMKDAHRRITPGAALLRFLCALVLVPTGISFLSTAFDRDRQFLHDRIAGTLLIPV